MSAMALEASCRQSLLALPATLFSLDHAHPRTACDSQKLLSGSQFLGLQLSQGSLRGERVRVSGIRITRSRGAPSIGRRCGSRWLPRAAAQPGPFSSRNSSKQSQPPRDVSASVGVAPRSIAVSPNIPLNQELLQQQKQQQQHQQQQQLHETQQRLEQRLSRGPAKSRTLTDPAVSAAQRLTENSSRLHDLLLQLATAQTLDEKDSIVSADPRVRAIFPQMGDSSLGKYVKPAVRMAMEACSREEVYLLKCLVASGQEHLLDTPIAWAEGLDAIGERANHQSEFSTEAYFMSQNADGNAGSSGIESRSDKCEGRATGESSAKARSGGGVKEAFSMLASMIDGWDAQLDAPRAALPVILAGLDNPGVFPAPLMDLIDWEDRRSAHNAGVSGGKGQEDASPLSSSSVSSSLFAQFMEGLEYPSVFGAPLLDLVDWEKQWQMDGDANSLSSSSGSSSSSSSSSGFVSDGGSSSSGSEDNAGYSRGREPRAQLQTLLAMLQRVEKFYDGIGGIIGYQSTCLDLIQQSVAASQAAAAAAAAAAELASAAPQETPSLAVAAAPPASLVTADDTSSIANEGENEEPWFESQRRFFVPRGQDLASDPEFASQAAFWGLEGLPAMAEIYPLGGAGDRLGLVDEETGESLPVAMLPYCGRTLLHGLVRDLEAREYLHCRVFGERHVTPVSIMTSAAKRNHERVLALLQQHDWFGRGQHNFRLFQQPLVPTVAAEDGRWMASGPLTPVLKPGGHGVIWKLAADEGVFDWLRSKGRKAAVIRQISNPLAATDMTLLALSGIGLHGNKKFGFASCDRNVGSAQGVNVLTEQQQPDGSWAYGVSCVEYTEFEKLGISDVPVAPGSSRSQYPANTNVLFADLEAVEAAVRGECGRLEGAGQLDGRAADDWMDQRDHQQQQQQQQKQMLQQLGQHQGQQPCCELASISSNGSSSAAFRGSLEGGHCAGLCGPDSTMHTITGGAIDESFSGASGSGSASLGSEKATSRSRSGSNRRSPSSPSSSSSSPPSLPGMIMNLKKTISFEDCNGRTQSIRGGRLECTMQNVADLLVSSLPRRLLLDHTDAATAASSSSSFSAAPSSSYSASASSASPPCYASQADEATAQVDRESGGAQAQPVQDLLDTFLVYNDRRKVTSSAKRRRKPTDTSLHQTPDGSFLDLNRNSLELFTSCGVAMPHMHSDHKRYVDSSPPFIFIFHPALGPLWSVIRQKVQGGSVAPRSEVKLEIAELAWSNVHVSGSLLIEADAVTGSLDPESGTTQLGHGCGRCRLHNVTVTNKGVDWQCLSNVYWQHRVQREEALRVVLRGDAEFEARDVTIAGDHSFEVPEGHKMVVSASKTGAMQSRLEKLAGGKPSWEWRYAVGKHGSLELTLVEAL